jgi:hypothetical protein
MSETRIGIIWKGRLFILNDRHGHEPLIEWRPAYLTPYTSAGGDAECLELIALGSEYRCERVVNLDIDD